MLLDHCDEFNEKFLVFLVFNTLLKFRVCVVKFDLFAKVTQLTFKLPNALLDAFQLVWASVMDKRLGEKVEF